MLVLYERSIEMRCWAEVRSTTFVDPAVAWRTRRIGLVVVW
jgi:hypothetical protein